MFFFSWHSWSNHGFFLCPFLDFSFYIAKPLSLQTDFKRSVSTSSPNMHDSLEFTFIILAVSLQNIFFISWLLKGVFKKFVLAFESHIYLGGISWRFLSVFGSIVYFTLISYVKALWSERKGIKSGLWVGLKMGKNKFSRNAFLWP